MFRRGYLHLPPALGFLPMAVGLALTTLFVFRWLAPSWWPALTALGFALQTRLRGNLPWPDALAIWIGQVLGLTATRGFQGLTQALVFTAPLPVWSLFLPHVCRYGGSLWLRWHDRLDTRKRRSSFALAALGLPIIFVTIGARFNVGLECAAFGFSVAIYLASHSTVDRFRWLWLVLGGLCALSLHLSMIGAFGAFRFMPYETVRFLTAPVAGFVAWSACGLLTSLHSAREGS